MTLYSLQLLRFMAALFVLLFHLNIMLSGYKGVDLFFVISGFVMYYSFSTGMQRASKFFINRATKIFFLYWLSLLVLYIVQPYPIQLLFLKTIFLIPGHVSVLGVSWSLSYEIYYYLLFGFVIYVIPKHYHRSIYWVLFIISTSITILNLTPYTLKGTSINFLLGQNFWQFLLGIASAAYLRFNSKTTTQTIYISLAFVCFLLYAFISILYNTSPASYIIYGILSAFMVYFFISFETQNTIPKTLAKLFKLLGDASYAMYLLGPIITIFVYSLSISYSKPIIIISTIGISILVNKLIENKFLNWSRKKLVQ